MSGRENVSPEECTTNMEDQREAEKLQARLRQGNRGVKHSSGSSRLPSVKIDEGAHKYVLIKASFDGEEQYFVTSKRGAHYHRNAAEPMIHELENAGYYDIEVQGGGRILYDENAKKISIFGYSYSFGQANHALSRSIVIKDPRYTEFDITISNEGY